MTGIHPSYLGASDEPQSGDVSLLIDHWLVRLAAYRRHLDVEPLFNPIRQLALEISRSLEANRLQLADLSAAAKLLSDRALEKRAANTRNYLGISDDYNAIDTICSLVRASAEVNGVKREFDEFQAIWTIPSDGIVFTGHPTFAMSKRLRAILVDLIERKLPSDGVSEELAETPHRPDADITLESEHSQALDAISNAQNALREVIRTVLEVAREFYPAEWAQLIPKPFTIASWVGYDLDGRVDISWADSIRFRLQEKQWQLARYRTRIEDLRRQLDLRNGISVVLEEIDAILRRELQAVERESTAFDADLSNPAHLNIAANLVTDRTISGRSADVDVLLTRLSEAIAASEGEAQISLATLRAEIASHRFGAALLHLRINAAQVHNAIRKPLGLGHAIELESRVLLGQLDEMISGVTPQKVNFASLALENSTAIRQFIAIAQIVKHIDAASPLRLLIAECEHPFTVLAAIYMARLFGVAGQVDISPLFETEVALEHGAAIIENLLRMKSYREYVQERGRISIQTGFSDAGRFTGQISASLSVERLHGQLARVIEEAGLEGIEILIFDTHGESLGRGAHPTSFRDRVDYLLSPWVRERYSARNLSLLHETSFQGGDGFVYFSSSQLALATLSGFLQTRLRQNTEAAHDPFYKAYVFSRDMHERVRSFQTSLFSEPNYGTTLAAFGTNLLVTSGSRKSKRQFDGSGDNRIAAAQMRAIPHNALLQQLGYAVNVVSGLGTALHHDREHFAALHKESSRIRCLVGMVRHAKALSSIKTIAAYASLFDDSFWVTRPLRDSEPYLKEACLLLAEQLRADPRHDSMMHLATYLRADAIHLHDLLQAVGEDTPNIPSRLELDLMHTLRIALIQHIFLLAARFPKFSTRNDISQQDVLRLVLGLNIVDAARMLREAFPMQAPEPSDYALSEPASYTGHEAIDYAELNAKLIDPMLSAFVIVQDITVGISHHFGAYG